MKRITAMVRPGKLDEIKSALEGIGLPGLTVQEIRGFGRQKGHSAMYRGAEYSVDFVPKLKLEVVVPDARADGVIRTIAAAAKTGAIGDGKIFVTPLVDVVRIRTGERGEQAV